MYNTIDKTYIIIYSNSLDFAGRKLAFRKRHLFDITNGTPKYIPKSEQGWWIGKQLLTKNKANELHKVGTVKVDVTHLAWYKQIQLDECFNLK